jgi:hypothetical protein
MFKIDPNLVNVFLNDQCVILSFYALLLIILTVRTTKKSLD